MKPWVKRLHFTELSQVYIPMIHFMNYQPSEFTTAFSIYRHGAAVINKNYVFHVYEDNKM